MNEMLTAYLRAVHALRGGRFSAADAISHIVNLMSAVQRSQRVVGKLMSFGRGGPGGRPPGGASKRGSAQHA